MNKHYTIVEAAKELNKSRNGILWLIRGRKLDAEKVIDPNGRAVWLIPESAIAHYRNGGKQQ